MQCFPTLFLEAHQQSTFWMSSLSDPYISGRGLMSWFRCDWLRKVGKSVVFEQIPNGSEHPYALLPLKDRTLEVGTWEWAGHLCPIMQLLGTHIGNETKHNVISTLFSSGIFPLQLSKVSISWIGVLMTDISYYCC